MVVVTAPAKVNFTLQIERPRPDGFHDLVSWVVPLDLSDELRVSLADAPGVRLRSDHADLPTDERNLVVRAARRLAAAAGVEPALDISLRKRVPIGAGLGGGSSDAAATLTALAQLWRLDWSRERLASIAAEIGSDVPLFLWNSSCVIRGRGERVEPVAAPKIVRIALVIPPFGMLTAAVYAALRPEDYGQPRPQPADLLDLSARELAPRLFNDLEPPAFRVDPRLADLHRRLSQDARVPVRLSGSGSSLFAIFDDAIAADAWRAECQRRLDGDVRTLSCGLRTT